MTSETPPLVSRRAVLATAAAAGAGLMAAPLGVVASLFGDDEPAQPSLKPSDTAQGDIPPELLAVYAAAAAAQCPGLPWPVLAAIGAVESGHQPAAVGPPLDGSAGVAAVPATPQGTAWHGDPMWERAVGMMQFLPATFQAYGVATQGRHADPFDPIDAAHSAAAYLCANGADDPSRLREALFAYNRADWYVEKVLAQAADYSAIVPAQAAAAGAVEPDYVSVALAQLGKPYRWGAAGPGAFDCSGLTSWSLARVGVTIPRVSADQARHLRAYGHGVSVQAAAGIYGALVFRIGVGAINHVVISLGDGRTVEAWRTGEPVQVKRLAGRQWTSAGLVPGLTYRAAPSSAPGGRTGLGLVTGAMSGAGTVARSVDRTGPRTAAGAARGPLTRTRRQGDSTGERAGQPPNRTATTHQHLSPPHPDALADGADRIDLIPRGPTAGGVDEKKSAEGARYELLSERQAPAACQAWPGVAARQGSAYRARPVAPALIGVEKLLRDTWGRISELTVNFVNSVTSSQTVQTVGAVVAVAGLLALACLLTREAATRRALRGDRRIRLTVLPTETFDPSEEEVARYAAQLSRTRRTLWGPGRRAQAVRLRLDSTGEGQCAYRIEGAPQAASILKLLGFDETELRPTDGLEPPGTSLPPMDPTATDGDAIPTQPDEPRADEPHGFGDDTPSRRAERDHA